MPALTEPRPNIRPGERAAYVVPGLLPPASWLTARLQRWVLDVDCIHGRQRANSAASVGLAWQQSIEEEQAAAAIWEARSDDCVRQTAIFGPGLSAAVQVPNHPLLQPMATQLLFFPPRGKQGGWAEKQLTPHPHIPTHQKSAYNAECCAYAPWL